MSVAKGREILAVYFYFNETQLSHGICTYKSIALYILGTRFGTEVSVLLLCIILCPDRRNNNRDIS